MRHHLLLSGTLVLLALLVLASPVQASEWIEGDGFRFRLPEGFERISDDLAGSMDSFNMNFGGGLLSSGPDIEMETRVFARDFGTTEQGILAAVRMTVGGDLGEKLKQQFDPQTMARQMQQGLEQASHRMGGGGAEVSEVKTTTLGASHEAVQLVLHAEDPRLGDQVIRMAFANYESSMYIFLLSGPPSRAEADESLWRAFATTVKLESVGGIKRLLEKYWPFLLGLVALLVLVVFLRSRGAGAPHRPTAQYAPSSVAGMNPDGASFSRAMDGLPMYDDGGSGGSSTPPGTPAHVPQAGARPKLRTVPTSQPAPLPGTDVAVAVPAASAGAPGGAPDFGQPPPSTAPAPEPPRQGLVSPPVVPSHPTDVARRAVEPPAAEGEEKRDRFQRNQDFLGP